MKKVKMQLAGKDRTFSNSLWHAEWHRIGDPRWHGKWILVFEDDASRFVVGFGVYEKLVSEYSGAVLENAIKIHGKPFAIHAGNGSVFLSVETSRRDCGITEFEMCMLKHRLKLLQSSSESSLCSGKIERFFSLFERTIRHFPSIEEFMMWYNCERSHGSLGFSTPTRVYYHRLAPQDFVNYPPSMEDFRERVTE